MRKYTIKFDTNYGDIDTELVVENEEAFNLWIYSSSNDGLLQTDTEEPKGRLILGKEIRGVTFSWEEVEA